MHKNRVRAVVLIACSLPLGACNSLFGLHFARHAPKPEIRMVTTLPGEAQIAAAPLTEAGRRQLDDGQIGLAAESFQKALGAGEAIAPAANGLGVAFARLGRYELALAYFQQAAAAAPTDARYAENIARLTRSPTMQMRRDADLAAMTLKGEAASGPSGAAVAAAEPVAAGRLQRVSRGEVRIVSAAPQSAPVRNAGVQVDRRFRPLIRVTLAETDKAGGAAVPAAPQGFVRVALPEPKPAAPDAGGQGSRR